MGIQEVKKKKLHQRRRHGVRAEDHPDDAKNNLWVLATLPLQQLKTDDRRRHGHQATANQEEERGGEEEEVFEEAVTPKGAGCRIPAEAETCPPAPKKPRTAAVLLQDSRRCNCDGEALEFFRVPLDLEAVFASLAAKAN